MAAEGARAARSNRRCPMDHGCRLKVVGRENKRRRGGTAEVSANGTNLFAAPQPPRSAAVCRLRRPCPGSPGRPSSFSDLGGGRLSGDCSGDFLTPRQAHSASTSRARARYRRRCNQTPHDVTRDDTRGPGDEMPSKRQMTPLGRRLGRDSRQRLNRRV